MLGGIPAWTKQSVTALSCGGCRHGSEVGTVRLERPLVFEDVAPRLWDATGDGVPEIVVVESHERLGARLAVWVWQEGEPVRLAATPHIGTRFRWLAPVAAGDLAGDGRPVIAYVDRPHLARDLVFVRLEDGALREIARVSGFSNHAIGETAIRGGLRRCGGMDEVLVPRADGGLLAALRIEGGRVVAHDTGTADPALAAGMCGQ